MSTVSILLQILMLFVESGFVLRRLGGGKCERNSPFNFECATRQDICILLIIVWHRGYWGQSKMQFLAAVTLNLLQVIPAREINLSRGEVTLATPGETSFVLPASPASTLLTCIDKDSSLNGRTLQIDSMGNL